MKNLFLITTPFQLLGSLEAIHHFNLKENMLIVVYNSLENNTKQLQALIEQNKLLFSTVIELGKNKKSKFFQNVFLIKRLQKNNYENIFIGDLGSIQKILISNLISNKIYLLDDGAKTIVIHKALEEKRELFQNNLRQFRFKLFGLKTSTAEPINIFTFFNFTPLRKTDIIEHHFEYFKSMYGLNNKAVENKVFILGQPLIENSRVKVQAYENYLNKVISLYENCEVFYLMHRREDKEQLLSYRLNKNINIIGSAKPGEFFFAELSYKPKAIIGVNTTLLFSLKKIFNDLDILSFRFDKSDIIRNLEWFEDAYAYFKSNKIQIIE